MVTVYKVTVYDTCDGVESNIVNRTFASVKAAIQYYKNWCDVDEYIKSMYLELSCGRTITVSSRSCLICQFIMFN